MVRVMVHTGQMANQLKLLHDYNDNWYWHADDLVLHKESSHDVFASELCTMATQSRRGLAPHAASSSECYMVG